jgi:hypothetical protein
MKLNVGITFAVFVGRQQPFCSDHAHAYITIYWWATMVTSGCRIWSVCLHRAHEDIRVDFSPAVHLR